MKQETLEEVAIKIAQMLGTKDSFEYIKNAVEYGAKWQAERMYSEEEVLEIFEQFQTHLPLHYEFLVKEYLKQFKKK